MEVLIDIPNLGAVRIIAKRMKHKRGRSTQFFWNADSAALKGARHMTTWEA